MTAARATSSILALAASASLTAAPALAEAPGYIHAEEEIGTVEQVYDGHLKPDLAVSTFRNIDRLFPTRTVEARGEPREMPESETRLENVSVAVGERTYDLFDALALNSITGLIVLKEGELVYETYQRGNRPETRWMSMSVVKSITSTLVGAAIVDGHIESLDDDVTRYVEALEGSAYEGVSVRDILLMASGVEWDETYTDPGSDRRDLLRAQLAQEPGGLMAVMPRCPAPASPARSTTIPPARPKSSARW